MEIAIVCDTPLQVLNSINLYYHQLQGLKCDLFIADSFRLSNSITDRIRKERIFENVYYYHYIPYKENGVKKVLETIFPEFYLKKALYNNPKRSLSDYAKIYISMPTVFSVLLSLCCPSAQLYYFEDGMGNYNGSITIQFHRMRKLIWDLLFRKYPNFSPKALYVNNPALCTRNGIKNVKQLYPANLWDDTFKELLFRVFDKKKDNIYKKEKYVYLTQPNDSKNEEIEKINIEIYDTLKNKCQNCIIRPHPRDNSTIPKSFRNVDRNNDMWELICQDDITEEHILIGQYSTAQVISKLMYDKEPTVIFTYLLYREILGEQKVENISKAVQNIKKSYRNKDRVLVVNDFEELCHILTEKC